jgi:propanol-preferring alcohol dehydrogenase
MRAVQYRPIGGGPEVVEVPTPEPGPGQIRLRVTAAGLCHSDWFVMDLPADKYAYGLPLTLGHEGAGVVDALGDGVTGAPEAYRRLHEGAVRGRAVVVPGD